MLNIFSCTYWSLVHLENTLTIFNRAVFLLRHYKSLFYILDTKPLPDV